MTDKWESTSQKCPKCGLDNVMCRTVTSSDGAYDDDEYKCSDCNYHWWVDGDDG